MNNRRSLILAAILFVGAIAAGYWGLVLSRQQPVAEVPVAQSVEQGVAAVEDKTRQAVVVLVRDVPPNVALTADDLTLEKLRTAPAGSLTAIDQAVGRTPWRSLSAGTWLSDQSFDVGGPLARMIRPDERALAVAIDEVSGAAGQFGPGDYVDILLFLRQDTANPEPSAQLVLPAVRVLSLGDELGLTSDGQPASAAPTPEQAQQQAARRGCIGGAAGQEAATEGSLRATPVERLDHPRDVVGVVLPIGIEGHHIGRALGERVCDARLQRGALAEVHGMNQHRGSCPQGDQRGLIVGTVIDHHHPLEAAQQ